MKAGLITFHRALNIGAVLQATALCEYINDNIMPCEIIDFVPNNEVPQHFITLHNLLHRGKATLLSNRPEYKRERAFKDFEEKYYHLSDKTYYGDKSLEDNAPDYCVLISGSDQIFNLTLSGNSKSYYLYFANNVKKVSYASSFGRSDISENEKQIVKDELPKFSYLSVREADGEKIIKGNTGIDSKLVLDPVFLLDRKGWEKKANKIDLAGDYILVYAMEYSQAIYETIEAAKQALQLPVFVICGGSSAEKLEYRKLDGIGPAEFIWLIQNAKYIITNSFHGSAFSIIFEKNFWCVAHSKRNVRLQNLADECDILPQLIGFHEAINTDNVLEYMICGQEANNRISGLITESKKYLSSVLEFRRNIEYSDNDASIRILHNEELNKYTTIRLGGTAKNMIIPQSVEGLIKACREFDVKYILGGGSNLLIANKQFENVLNLREFNTSIVTIDSGYYKVGASVRLQKLLRTINDDGFGGIEYLCTVPGLVGASVAMNAGTSKSEGKFISDYVECIFALNRNTLVIEKFTKEQCRFSFRNSIFKNNSKYIITEVWFKFIEQSKEKSKELIEKKKEFSRKYQDTSKPNFGSVYSKFDHNIMRAVQILQLGNKKGIHFSKKSFDWIINEGSNDSDYAISLIRKVKRWHLHLGKECRVEVVIWE